MSRRSNNSPKLELRLNLSPPRANQPVESPDVSVSSWEMSGDQSSCVSSEPEQETTTMHYASSSPPPEAIPMLLAGCPRCLMYVMLSDVDPKCPKCKSTVLLDFLNEENTKKSTTELGF